MAVKQGRKRLKSMKDVRVYLANLINATRSGEVEQTLAGRLAYMLNILRGIVADTDLESRLSQLEENWQKQQEGKP